MFSSLNTDIRDNVSNLARKLSSGSIKSTFEIVLATVSVLKDIISNSEWTTAKDLMQLITTNGKYLMNAFPLEASVGNMVRRVLQIIREEYSSQLENKTVEVDPVQSSQSSQESQESLHKILTSKGDNQIDFTKSVPDLKEVIMEHISEFEVELETCAENITEQASKHIHSNEIVMTIGRSRLVEQFLKKAAESRTFEVIVVEGGPFLEGHPMAMSLGKQIPTTLISDSAIFGMMSRVNKVIIGTHTVMADGGLRAITGSHTLARAANHYSVPVMVLLPLYKLSPQHICSSNEQNFNKHVSPLQGVINGTNSSLMEKIHSYNPVFDYVPADLVTLFISNSGGNAPSYVYRLLSELYHPDDYEL